MKLRKKIKKAWIAALISGEYQQGKEALKRAESHGNKFCCLGVLCDLAVKAGVGQWRGEAFVGATGKLAASYLPGEVLDWAFKNLDQDHHGRVGNPYVTTKGGRKTLAELNDNTDKGFTFIAKRIKESL